MSSDRQECKRQIQELEAKNERLEEERDGARRQAEALADQITGLLEAMNYALGHLEDGDPREAREHLEAVLPEEGS